MEYGVVRRLGNPLSQSLAAPLGIGRRVVGVAPPVNTVAPSISGTPGVGQTLTASNGTWTGTGIVYTYQWKRDGASIGGETASTHVVVSADLGTTITVTVTATNAGGAVSATSAGQAVSSLADPVAFWKLSDLTDASGRGNTLTNNNTATFTTGKVGNAVSCASASSQYLSRADNADLSMGAGVYPTFAGWFKCTDLSAVRMVLSKWTNTGPQREYRIYITATGVFAFGINQTGAAVETGVTSGAGAVTAGSWYFFVCWYDGTKLYAQLNNGTIFSANYTSDIFNGTAQFQLGQETSESYKMNGLIDAVGVWKRVLTSDERTLLYNGGGGLEYPFDAAGSAYTVLPAHLADNGYTTDLTDYYLSSPFARLVATTTADRLWLSLWDNMNSTYATFDQVNIRVNGADHAQVNPGANGAHYSIVTLPGGDQTVEIVASLQSKPSSTVLGTFIKAVGFNAPATLSQPTSSRLLIYGDSIAVGANASVPSKDGWAVLLRNYRGASLSTMVEGWGYRSLNDDCSDSTARAAFVARLAGYAPSIIWLAIGTNDYGLNKWSAASFGTAYAALLDDLHTALPSATIYCQTPIVRSTETANGSGSTLGNYRTQISTAQSSRTGYAVLVDGSAILTTGDLDDGIHPLSAGHALYYAAVKTALGI